MKEIDTKSKSIQQPRKTSTSIVTFNGFCNQSLSREIPQLDGVIESPPAPPFIESGCMNVQDSAEEWQDCETSEQSLSTQQKQLLSTSDEYEGCAGCDCDFDTVKEIFDFIKKEGYPNNGLLCHDCYAYFLPKFGCDALQQLKPP